MSRHALKDMNKSLPIRIARKFLCRQVLEGPFKGMAYTNESYGSTLMPKILGTYELELHEVLSKQLQRQPLKVVDVGAAEGYYAVGTLYSNPQAHVTAFEATGEGRTLMLQLAKKNGVQDRLQIEGLCTPVSFNAALHRNPGALVVMDVEGAEEQLLDPEAVPGLTACTIVVEIHDDLGILIRQRFEASHNILSIASRQISPSDIKVTFFRLIASLSQRLTARLLQERPYAMTWLYMVPKRPSAASS